jgi:hypothetical protein
VLLEFTNPVPPSCGLPQLTARAIGAEVAPPWVLLEGCVIATPGEDMTYHANGDLILPDAFPLLTSAWVGDENVLKGLALEHVRFRVTFDLAANGAPLTLASPRPSLEFLRVLRN